MLPRIAFLAVVVLALAACSQTPSPEPSAGPTVTPPVIAGPSSVLLSCGGEEDHFPAAALAGLGLAEFENDAAAAVLKAAIVEGAEPLELPQHGWHRVAAGPSRVLFVAPRPGDRAWAMVALRPDPDGWALDEYGDCEAAPVLPKGVAAADFWLDPAAPPPGPDATTLHGLIVEQACANGKPPTGRVRPPVVVYGEETVTVTVTVRETPGGADCPGNPSAPITIELSQPLGDRTVLDGSVFPPRDTSAPPA